MGCDVTSRKQPAAVPTTGMKQTQSYQAEQHWRRYRVVPENHGKSNLMRKGAVGRGC